MSSKRPRSPSPTHSHSSSPSQPRSRSPSASPAPKVIHTSAMKHRSTESGTTSVLTCSLPPTCNPPRNPPTQLADTKALEAHYSTFHTWVCEQKGCQCVFPEERLLELHQTECHDPIADVRKARGEKIFACFVPAPICTRSFSTPKTRRMHLIQAHGYPKTYFFSVTNKGVAELLKKWGAGASLVRGEWKARRFTSATKDEREGEKMDMRGSGGDSDEGEDEDGEEEDDADDEEIVANPPTKNPYLVHPSSPRPHSHPRPKVVPPQPQSSPSASSRTDATMDDLSGALTALSLVPTSIRFGRGGKRGGFARPSGASTASKNAGAAERGGKTTHANGGGRGKATPE